VKRATDRETQAVDRPLMEWGERGYQRVKMLSGRPSNKGLANDGRRGGRKSFIQTMRKRKSKKKFVKSGETITLTKESFRSTSSGVESIREKGGNLDPGTIRGRETNTNTKKQNGMEGVRRVPVSQWRKREKKGGLLYVRWSTVQLCRNHVSK